MHTLGKVCLWTSVVLMFVACVLTAELYTARAFHVKSKVQLEAKQEKNVEALRTLRVKTLETRNELASTLLAWDRMPWENVNVTVFAENNSLEINIGTVHGLLPTGGANDQTKQQVVYCYQPAENGAFTYVGDFRVSTAEGERAALTPNWEVQPGESDDWNAEQPWRVRALIPSQFQTRFNGLERQLTDNMELLDSKITDLEKQGALLVAANERLAARVAEIDGPSGEVTDAEKRPREDVVGLLTALEEFEEDRNNVLAIADHLRRVLLNTLTNFDRTQAENLRLVDNLPKEPQSGETTQASSN